MGEDQVTRRTVPTFTRSNSIVVKFVRARGKTHTDCTEREQLSVRCWMTLKVSIWELRPARRKVSRGSVTNDIRAESSGIHRRIVRATSISLFLQFDALWKTLEKFLNTENKDYRKLLGGSSSTWNKRVFGSSFPALKINRHFIQISLANFLRDLQLCQSSSLE